MKAKFITSNGHQQYILTQTLYDHLKPFRAVGLPVISRSFIEEIEKDLKGHIEKSLEGTKSVVESIPFDEFCGSIVASAKQLLIEMPDAIVVSTTRMITYEAGGKSICVGLSRLVDLKGKIITVGSRAGFSSVEKQIDEIAKEVSGRRVIVIEDGSFTGSTLCYLLEKLSKTSRVEAIIMGLLFLEARKKLEKVFRGRLICKYDFENPFEWMPSHDFFPFIPNSGRVIGTQIGTATLPLYLHDRSTLSKPYTLPYGDPVNWASLPMDRYRSVMFSRFCINSSIEIFQEMEKLHGKPIVVGDVIKTSPVVSVPFPMGRSEICHHTTGDRVIDVLNEDYQWLIED